MPDTDPYGRWQGAPVDWHRGPFNQLLALSEQGRLPHALLINGPVGVGKTQFASALAAFLLCSSAEMRPCRCCDACSQARVGSHGDYRWVTPEEGKRAIGIDAIRSVIDFVQQTAGYGARKVVVVTPAEAMTLAAANALLKTLEEPAGDSVICLISDRPGDLPATVRSRCQSVTLPMPSQQEAVDWLTKQLAISPAEAAEALTVSNHQVMTAFSAIADGSIAARSTLTTVLDELFAGKRSSLAAVDDVGAFLPEVVIETMMLRLEHGLRRCDRTELAKKQAVFELRDELLQLQRALRSGANLGKDFLLGDVCRKGRGVLA